MVNLLTVTDIAMLPDGVKGKIKGNKKKMGGINKGGKMKITEGKWIYQEDSDVYTHIVRPAENLNRIIATCGQDSTGESEANAHLIASAPDLLESHEMNVIYAKAVLKARRLWKHGTSIEPIINGFIECLQGIVKRSESIIAKSKNNNLASSQPAHCGGGGLLRIK